MANNQDQDGYSVKNGAGTNPARKHSPYQHFEVVVNFDDLSAGASDTAALTGFPLNAFVASRSLEVVIPFAGEADVAVSGGDTGDPDGQFTSFNLNAVAAGFGAITPGVEDGPPTFEADWETDGAQLTFTATELGDLTAGQLIYRVYYFAPALSTD